MFNILITAEIHKKLKIRAIHESKNMQQLLDEILRGVLK